MANPFGNPLFNDIDFGKKLESYGVSVHPYKNTADARGETYTTRDDGFPPTPIFSPINPFNDEIRAAKNVLEIGCGVGRNLPIIMEETNSHFWSVDPNIPMMSHFWKVQDQKYKDRVSLYSDFVGLPADIIFDFVLVTFVFQHIGFRPNFRQMNVADITRAAMKHTRDGTVWFVLEHEREEQWQERWMKECGITPDVYYKPGGNHAGGGTLPYPEFESMTHRGNDNNLIIFRETK